MTAFDYVVLTILGASIAISLFRGLVREVLSLAAWLAAFVVANWYGPSMAALLPIPGDTVRLVVGFAVLFVGTLLLAALVNHAIAQLVAASRLKAVDRGLGGLFGFGRGVLIVMTLAMLAGLTALPQQPVWRDAVLAPVTEDAVRAVKPWLPETWARYVHY